MKVLVSWLRELVDVPVGIEALAERLHLAGFELVLPGEGGRGSILGMNVELLFDPKRVRAARAGIPLAPIDL